MTILPKFKALKGLFAIVYLCSCNNNNNAEPSLVEILTNTWQLETLEVDGQIYHGDISLFHLTLNRNMTFYRIHIDGVESSGDWQLINNEQILLVNNEEYIIKSFNQQNIVLNATVKSEKTGNRDHTYHLVRTK